MPIFFKQIEKNVQNNKWTKYFFFLLNEFVNFYKYCEIFTDVLTFLKILRKIINSRGF